MRVFLPFSDTSRTSWPSPRTPRGWRYAASLWAMALAAAASPAQARATVFEEQLGTHIAQQWLGIELTPALVEQLAWLQDNPSFTPEAAVRRRQAPPPPFQREVLRALSRLSCGQLLARADRDAYALFVTPQPPDNRLSFEAFERLAGLIAGHGPQVRDAVFATASVAMSPTARGRCQQHAPDRAWSPDSELFLSEMAGACLQVLPIS